MTYEAFAESLTQAKPPVGLNPIIEALWHDAKGYWERAHEIAQRREGTPEYDHLHAYLHRKEGDQFKAGYWYRRAKMPVFTGSLDDEWQQLVRHCLQGKP